MQLFGRARVKPMQICVYGHPVLKRPARDVDAITDETRELVERMIVTMHDSDGIGLAAPQVGVSLNLIVLDVPPPDVGERPAITPGEISLLPRMPLAMINPKLSDFSEQTEVRVEGCLSVPGVDGDVERPEFVQVTFQTLAGETVGYRCGGLLSRCIQHECDHLTGKLFVERIPKEQFDAAGDTLAELERISKKQVKNRNKEK